jgi:uncharacterized protein YjdB
MTTLCFSGQLFAADVPATGVTFMKESVKQMDIGNGLYVQNAQHTVDGGVLSIAIDMTDEGSKLVKTDKDGAVQWSTTLVKGYASSQTFEQTPEGDVLFASQYINASDGKDFAGLSSIDQSGKINWSVKMKGNGEDFFRKAIRLQDGSIVAIGYSSSTDGDYAALSKGLTQDSMMGVIVKFDKDGHRLWAKSKVIADSLVQFQDVTQTKEGRILVLTHKKDIHSAVLEYNLDGGLVSEKDISDLGTAIHATDDGGYLLLGQRIDGDNLPFVLGKYEPTGKKQWEHLWANTAAVELSKIVEPGNGIYLVAGMDTHTLSPILETFLLNGELAYQTALNKSGKSVLLDIRFDDEYTPSYVLASLLTGKLSVMTYSHLDKAMIELGKGDVYSILAKLTPYNATVTPLKWVSSNPKVASVDTMGNVTAKAEGTAKVTVSNETKTFQASLDFHVTNPIKMISIEADNYVLKAGESLQLKTDTFPSGAEAGDLTWRSSNKAVISVDQQGKVTAHKNGNASIKVTTKDGKCMDAIGLIVSTPAKSIALNAKALTISVKESYTLHAQVLPTNTYLNNVSWKSSDTKIATVNGAGKVTALKPGKVTITATVLDQVQVIKAYSTDENGNKNYQGRLVIPIAGKIKTTCKVTIVK